MRNTWTVIRFEVARSLKKPSFWVASLLLPIILAAYILICSLIGYNTGEAISGTTNTTDMKLAVFDEAEILQGRSFTNNNEEEQTLEDVESREAGIEQIKNGSIDVFYYIPSSFDTDFKLEIYAKPEKLNIVSDYSEPIHILLEQSALKEVSVRDYTIIKNDIQYETTKFGEDNEPLTLEKIASRIGAPIIAIALFYVIMIILGNRISVSMVEEKENRISELLLTSLKPIHLIAGKVISLMIIGIVQISALVIPVAALVIVANNKGLLPLDISAAINWPSIAQYGVILIAGYFLFTVSNILIGTFTSTAKDASSFAGIIILPMFLSFMMINVFISGENLTLIRFLNYFPLTAPSSILLRAIFTTVPKWEYFLVLADIIVSSLLILKLATTIFCKNAIASGSKIDLKKTFGSTRKTWKN